MDKFNALTTLVCVVEQNSFSRAAEQLGKTPSAVAKAIAALEEEQGIRLFERTTRRMQLTEAGRLYAQAAREALNCLSNASEAPVLLQLELSPSGEASTSGDAWTGAIEYSLDAMDGKNENITFMPLQLPLASGDEQVNETPKASQSGTGPTLRHQIRQSPAWPPRPAPCTSRACARRCGLPRPGATP